MARRSPIRRRPPCSARQEGHGAFDFYDEVNALVEKGLLEKEEVGRGKTPKLRVTSEFHKHFGPLLSDS